MADYPPLEDLTGLLQPDGSLGGRRMADFRRMREIEAQRALAAQAQGAPPPAGLPGTGQLGLQGLTNPLSMLGGAMEVPTSLPPPPPPPAPPPPSMAPPPAPPPQAMAPPAPTAPPVAAPQAGPALPPELRAAVEARIANAAPPAALPQPAPAPQAAPPPVSPAAPPPVTPPGANRWENAIPAPAEYVPFIQAASKRYGVPEAILTWMGGHESNWRPDAMGIPTSSGRAMGMYQFKAGTAKDLGIDPMKPPEAIDGAARYLKTLYDKNGGDWTKAVAAYGSFSTGKGPEADALVRAGFEKFIGAAPSTQTAAAAPRPPIAGSGDGGGGDAGFDVRALIADALKSNKELAGSVGTNKASMSEKLMTLSAGLLGGPNFGAGLGVGLKGLADLQKSDRDGVLKAAQVRSQMAGSLAQQGAAFDRLGQTDRRLLIQAQEAERQRTQGNARIAQGNTRLDQNGVALEQGAGRLANQTAGVVLDTATTTDKLAGGPEARGVDAAAEKGWQVEYDKAQTGTAEMFRLKDAIANQRKIIASDPSLQGSTVRNSIARFMTKNFGIGADENTLSLSEKNLTDIQTSIVKSAFGGVLSGRVPLGEFNQIAKTAATVETNPAAALILLDEAEKTIDRSLGAQKALRDRVSNGMRLGDVVRETGGTNAWLSRHHEEQHKENLGVGVSPNPGTPTIQKPPGGQWQSTTSNGIKFTITD